MSKDRTVILKVNDRKIPLNPFVTDVFTNVVDGLVNSLDKIPENKDKIEIIIQ